MERGIWSQPRTIYNCETHERRRTAPGEYTLQTVGPFFVYLFAFFLFCRRLPSATVSHYRRQKLFLYIPSLVFTLWRIFSDMPGRKTTERATAAEGVATIQRPSRSWANKTEGET